jgi:hypothetical protein
MPNAAPGSTQRAASKFIIFENFEKLNTQELRTALKESEFSWVENLQPLANNNWTTVPGAGNSLISIPQTINLEFFGTLNGHDTLIIFTTAGSAWAFSDLGNIKFAPDGTFSLNPDCTSWEGQRFLFNDSIAGYCSYDGTTFTRQGGVSANITVTNGGSGYTSPPTVTISGGSGSGATAVATIGAPAVTQVILDAGGSGYSSPPAVGFSGGGGAGASASTNIDPRACLGVVLDNPGAYAKDGVGPYNVTISFVGGGGSGASATLTLSQNALGQVFVVSIDNFNGGSGYTSIPSVVFTPNAHLGTITPAAAHVTGIGAGQVTSINFNPATQGGSGYTSAPNVTITGGGGSGALAHAVIGGAQVVSIKLTNPGQNYLPSDVLTVTISGGGGSGATATARVAPFIPKGTSVAVFGGRVWLNFFVNNQLTGLQWSGTGTANVEAWNNWDVANASGALILPDTDLVHQITGLRSFNNFLWIIGDQSIKQIGNISINKADNTTVFTILTLSSDQGTTYLKSCASFNRVFFFVNQNGVYAVFGSSVQKISDDLDGIFQNADFTLQPQASLVDMGNVHNVMWLLRYHDTIFTNTTRAIFIIFNGRRWFVGSQGDSIKAVVGTVTLASPRWVPYASSGSDVSPIFNSLNSAVTFRLQTALSHHQNPVQRKKSVRLGWAVTLEAAANSINLSADTDEASKPFTANLVTGFQTRTVADPNVSGTYMGLTVSGILTGFTLSNLRIEYQETNIGNQN